MYFEVRMLHHVMMKGNLMKLINTLYKLNINLVVGTARCGHVWMCIVPL